MTEETPKNNFYTSAHERIMKLMLDGSPAVRRECIKKGGFKFFAIYYFAEFFTYPWAPFHFDFSNDLDDVFNNKLDELLWIAFRESAKTTLVKMFLAYIICEKKKRFINVDSYAKENSEAILYDVSTWLRTNKKIIFDYGRLYIKHKRKKSPNEEEDEEKIHRMGSFITENGIKVAAYSTQESTRGRIYQQYRPDLFIFDDIENSKTVMSYPITNKIISHINEARAGMAPGASIIYLGNYISETGVMAHVMEHLATNERARKRMVNLTTDDEISWPGKYVWTKEAAAKANENLSDPLRMVLSIEGKLEQLGNKVFQAEMMNNPAASQDIVFDREHIESLMKKTRKPIEETGGMKVWSHFNPSHIYIGGADTAEGIGRDSNASAILDLSTIPNRVVATYKNNMIGPDVFGNELKRQGDKYGTCMLAPEINQTGYATITRLLEIYDANRIYIQSQDDRVHEKLAEKYGFQTNGASKPDAIFQLKSAVEDGLLEIYDKELLEELKYYSQKDLQQYRMVDGMTRHFDLLMAVAIAWACRHSAKKSNSARRPFKQAPHVPATEYGG